MAYQRTGFALTVDSNLDAEQSARQTQEFEAIYGNGPNVKQIMNEVLQRQQALEEAYENGNIRGFW